MSDENVIFETEEKAQQPLNEVEEQEQEQEQAPTKRKPKKELSPEKKAELVERLRKGREKARAKKNAKVEDNSAPPVVTKTKTEKLKEQKKEIKEDIKEAKDEIKLAKAEGASTEDMKILMKQLDRLNSNLEKISKSPLKKGLTPKKDEGAMGDTPPPKTHSAPPSAPAPERKHKTPPKQVSIDKNTPQVITPPPEPKVVYNLKNSRRRGFF